MLADLLRRRWVVMAQFPQEGHPEALPGRHYSERRARRRADSLRWQGKFRYARVFPAMLPRRTRPIPGVLDPSAPARHRASGRPA